jgi:hypothetical protein
LLGPPPRLELGTQGLGAFLILNKQPGEDGQ